MLRSVFIALSTNRPLRSFSERNALGQRLSRRFVAGMSIDEAVDVVAELNAENIEASLDSLGESVVQVSQAEESAALYHQLLDRIAARKLRANISVKLTAMGMDIGGHGAGPALAERVVGELVAHAAETQSFVRLDMEGSDYTEATLCITERLHSRYPGCVGAVLQAYLFRTAEDTERLLRQAIAAAGHPHPALQGRLQRAAHRGVSQQGGRGRKLRPPDAAHGVQRRVLRGRHPRRGAHRPNARPGTRRHGPSQCV